MDTETRDLERGGGTQVMERPEAARVAEAAPEEPAIYPPPVYPPATDLTAPPASTYPAAAPVAPAEQRTNVLVTGLVGIALLLVLVLALVWALAGWAAGSLLKQAPIVGVGSLTTRTQSVSLGDATTANISLNMGAGDLTVAGGASNLLDATFTYNVPAWNPNVRYDVNGSIGQLTVEQPSVPGVNASNTRYTWDLRLANNVPLNLKATLGAGNNTLDLSGLSLTGLVVSNGAGNTTVDLSGTWTRNLTAVINGGVGNTTLRIPHDVGVRVTTQHGLGQIHATGLHRNGDTYTNDAYGKTPVSLDLTVSMGVGQLTIDEVR